MRAARRWCIVAALAASLAACGDAADQKATLIGNDITFDVPASPGSNQMLRLQGIERGSGPDGVVLAHMLGSSQNAWAPLVEDLVDDGFHVLTFDFRGHGLSGGERDPAGAGLDLAGAVTRLRALGATRVLVVGASMGGTAALAVGDAQDLEGVVTLSAPVSIGPLDAAAGLRAYKGPLLVMVGENDDSRYTDAARAIIGASSSAPKRRQVIDGSGKHGTDLLSDESVERSIVDFLNAHRG